MKLKYDAVWVEPNMVNMNEVYYDLWNEWDGNEWRNEWDGYCFMKWMWWMWQGNI